MAQTLEEIAIQLSTSKIIKKIVKTETKQIAPKEIEETKQIPKVQLIYAFNGTGKTRLSKEFKGLIAPKIETEDDLIQPSRTKILYYNAFTEDLFSWDNDLENDSEPKLIIKSNSFTDWIFQEQGQDQNIIANFQRYTDDKLTPRFNQQYLKDENDPTSIVRAFSEVSFSFKRGDENSIENIKISRGEESNFIWSVFYTLLKQVISVKNDEESSQFDSLEYIFIDDPVSSLDENHLIELAIDLSQLIKSSNFEKHKLRFIISTHNPLFYNVLYNELEINKKKSGYMLTKNEDGTFELNEKHGDSNKNFSYHLFLIETIKQAVKNNGIEKFHFMLLRNLYEKTASFLGYPQWSQLLPTEARDSYVRYINLYSHKSLSNEEVSEPTPAEKNIVNHLLEHLINEYSFWKEVENNES